MKRFTLTCTILCAFFALAYAGSESYSGKEKEVLQPAPPACDWYRAHEWDLNIWGTYAFPANTGRLDLPLKEFDNGTDRFENEEIDAGRISADTFINRDNAWGGGADIKFFFSKYWALGAEGFVLDANDNIGGAGLGTFTFRWPIGCSRFAPYAFGGFGALGGGSHTNRFHLERTNAFEEEIESDIERSGKNHRTLAIGQFGAGLEVRITRHIGVMGDFAWNVVQERDNDFGMARFGVTLSY